MIIFPAIDIRGGRCVRLVQGEFDKETVYGDDPSLMALKWQQQGATYLHVVDLDGAKAGSSQNLAAVQKILAKVTIPVQIGGGIRNLEQIERLLDLGIARVILGSVAVKKPELVAQAAKLYPGRIVAGIDAKNGIVAVEGWGISGELTALELAKKMRECGVEHIVFTDIARDGMLGGVNVEATAALAKASGVKIIASGGVAGLKDITDLKEKAACGIEGVIVGKALYTRAVTLPEVLKIAGEEL